MPEGVIWFGEEPGETPEVGAEGVVIESWDDSSAYPPVSRDVTLAYLSVRWSLVDANCGPGRFVVYPRAPIGLRAARYHVDKGGRMFPSSMTGLCLGAGLRVIRAIEIYASDVAYDVWRDGMSETRDEVRTRQDRRLVFRLEPKAAIAFEPYDGVQAARLMVMNAAAHPPDRAGEELRLRLTLH